MTGERLYRIHRATAVDLGIAELPAWAELPSVTRASWDQSAFEQDLRDRSRYGTLHSQKGAIHYDGPNAD